jgi:hypothetical protein
MKPQTQTKNQKLIEYLNTLNLDIDFNDNINIEDEITSFDDLQSLLDDNNALIVNVIYYSNAMKLLSENDASLQISLNLAVDFGYDITNINSETLASLLATDMLRDEFFSYKNQINDFINELY